MIPVDIGNFIITKINMLQRKKSIFINKKIKYIPMEYRKLYIHSCEIVDISSLSKCTALKWLSIDNNKIVDITFL